VDGVNTASAALLAASGFALYVGHHVGDYWVQTDHQALHKGDAGWFGRWACAKHVVTYTLTQALCLAAMFTAIGWPSLPMVALALAVSAATHYAADRREHGLMFALVRLLEPLAGKASFMRLGAPRPGVRVEQWADCPSCGGRGVGGSAADESTGGRCWDCRGGGKLPHHVGDNSSLGTGAWALDQAWHIALGVFIPALIIAS
jgi:hypothetical protein